LGYKFLKNLKEALGTHQAPSKSKVSRPEGKEDKTTTRDAVGNPRRGFI
jgi:hypothetical protein